jgi:hypothetical protein
VPGGSLPFSKGPLACTTACVGSHARARPLDDARRFADPVTGNGGKPLRCLS